MNAPVEKVVGDVRVLATDLEELVKASAALSGEKLAQARIRVQSALSNARDVLIVHGSEALHTTDRYVHQNAWKAVGISGVLGLLVGLLIGRRD